MAGGSKKVIIISLCANMAIAISKFVGASFTGSAALLAEAVHSLADCGNQGLLLYGQHAAAKPVTPQYPLGRGKEGFFWSFVVALLLFSMGGLFSLYEGWHKLHAPEALSFPEVGAAILFVAVLLEGYSFYACLKEVRAQSRGSLLRWMRETTSADLLVIFLEDFAALLGLVLALISLALTAITGNPLWDALGSMAIGALLVLVAVVLAREVKSLLIGEAPSDDYAQTLEAIRAAHFPTGRILKLIAVQTGVGEVTLSYKLHPGEEALTQSAGEVIATLNRMEAEVRSQLPNVRWQFAELDTRD